MLYAKGQLRYGSRWVALYCPRDLIGFYALTTPIAQPSVTAPNGSATTGTNEAAIVRITAALVNLGLIVTT